jgi:hypothetical protein
MKFTPCHGFINAEAVFLVMLGMSSFPGEHEVYEKPTENILPSWERGSTQQN